MSAYKPEHGQKLKEWRRKIMQETGVSSYEISGRKAQHEKSKKACAQEGCPEFGVTSNPQYKGYCHRCFIYNFPDNTIVRNYKTKERAVVDFVRSAYPDYTWILDKQVEGGCSRKRPDILLDMGEFVLNIEVDENQHGAHDCTCENKRLMQIFLDVGSRPLVVIRFNPDTYTNNKDNDGFSSE
jgi:hypothetical protein